MKTQPSESRYPFWPPRPLPRAGARSYGPLRTLVWLLALLVVMLERPAYGSDFDLRRVSRAGKGLVIYHDPVQAPAAAEMRVTLSRGGCDVTEPTKNVRQAGDSFATLIVIDRGDPNALGRWSEAILGGVGDFLRSELTVQRAAPDEYAVLDSYGTPPPREQPLTSQVSVLESFLTGAPKPQAAGAAIYRRTLDGLRLLEPTQKPLRAVMVISDGRDPNLYPGGVAEDSLLIEKSKELGAPIFVIVVARTPLSKLHRSELQAAAQRLQAVSVRSGGTVVREVRADETLRSSLGQALSAFSRQIGLWDRTECGLCGRLSDGDASLELAAEQDGKPVARCRKPIPVKLMGTEGVPACTQCEKPAVCSCKGEGKPECKRGKCQCEGDCSSNADCPKGQTCKQGKCQKGPPWMLLVLGGGFLLLVLVGLLVIVQVIARTRAGEARRREEEERRRLEADAWHARQREDQRRREEQERHRQGAEPKPAAEEPAARYRPPPTPPPPAPPAPFRLHSRTAGYGDIPLGEGATVIGGDAHQVQAAVGGLPPDFPGTGVVVPAATISGRHAVVRVLRGAVSVTDFGSTNGTFVNGVRIQPNGIVELRPGDEVEVSRHVTYVLEVGGGPR
jgi:hypothetical protein